MPIMYLSFSLKLENDVEKYQTEAFAYLTKTAIFLDKNTMVKIAISLVSAICVSAMLLGLICVSIILCSEKPNGHFNKL